MLVSSDDQVKAYIKKIMSQLDKWMVHGKISKLVVVITSKDTGEHVERWQFDVQIFNKSSKKGNKGKATDKENAVPEYISSPLLSPHIFANEDIGAIPPPQRPRKPTQKSKPRSSPSSDKSQRPSLSCPN
jgi:hypothetical protein